MPAGDRTGPWGLGPRTGRGLGYCAGFPAPGFMFPGSYFGFGRGIDFRRGFGRGLGRGRGRRFWHPWFGYLGGYPYPPLTPFQYPFGAGLYYSYPPFYGQFYGPGYSGRQPQANQEKKK